MMFLCGPALIYFVFSIIEIFFDIYNKYYNNAITKTFVVFMITFLLQMLCMQNLSIIAWLLVSIPFIMMTTITFMLLYSFGFDKNTGKINCLVSNPNLQVATITTPLIKPTSSSEDTNNNTSSPDFNSYIQSFIQKQQQQAYSNANINPSQTTTTMSPSIYNSSPAYQSGPFQKMF